MINFPSGLPSGGLVTVQSRALQDRTRYGLPGNQ